MEKIVERLRRARAVQLVGHIHPDGDCIGSLLGLHHMLGQWGVAHAMAAGGGGAGGYDLLPGYELIREEPDPAFAPDLVVFVDTASLERGPESWRASAPIINIDHHGGNTRFGEINWIKDSAAATGEMIYQLARHGAVTITPALAEALLVALSTDTGSFRFSNTGALQHRLAAELIEAGAMPTRVAKIGFESQPIESLRLTGRVLSGLRLTAGGRLAWSEARAADYAEMGGPERAPENLVGALRSVRGVAVAILFHELPERRMRVNFRSDGSFDVRALAERWGGGGHTGAAGLTLEPVDYEAKREEILRTVTELLDRG